ncbi:MAG: hypothetical protein RDV48_22335 [Candidatus Eremiobacteraeota bacterium]|nr:hypothetical protein [Candidatus Eremiobacteraeota bacterium]
MDKISPVDRGMTNTPIRMPERLQLEADGSVQVHAATDKVEIKGKKAKKEKDGILANTTKTILSGVGLGSGVVGGGIIGAGIGSGGSALASVMGNGFTWAAVSTGGVVGGIAGAALFGVAGTYGGWKFAEALIGGGKFMKKLLFTKEPLSQEQQAALENLKAVEDSPKDAQKVLKFIAGGLSGDESLENETALYSGLLSHFGNKNTDAALSAYATFKNHLPPGEERDKALGELGKFTETFKAPEDAMDALYAVLTNLNAKDSIPAECESLRSVAEDLKKCSANGAEVTPGMAGETYATIKANFSPSERKEAIAATLGQFGGARMEPKDAIENLKFIVNNRQKGDDLAQESKNLLGLLEQTDGSLDTARLAYQTTKANFPPGGRGEALKLFFDLATLEKSPQNGAAVLVELNKGLYKGEDLKEQIGFYKDMHKLFEGSSNPAKSSLEAYKTVTSYFKKGSDRDNAVEFLTKLTAAEKAAGQDTGNAAGDLAFVYTHVSEGEKFPNELEKFIGLLGSEGSSSKAQKKYVDAKFQELYGK